MRGLLSGTSKFSNILVTRKRHGAVQVIARKKARKVQGQASPPKDEAPSAVVEDVQTADMVEERAEIKTPTEAQAEEPISYHGHKAIVSLQPNQKVALDGWAMVRLVEGRAAVHGYSLSPGVEVVLSSSSKLSAVVAVESKASAGLLGRDGHPVSSPNFQSPGSDEFTGISEKRVSCVLEFQSYRGVTADSAVNFNANDDGSPVKRTFRIEIYGENGVFATAVGLKRKSEELAGSDRKRICSFEEEHMSGSGEDDEEDGEQGRDLSGQENADMEVDDLLSDPDIVFDVSPDRTNLRKETHSPLNATVIPDSWWACANSIHDWELDPSSYKDGETAQGNRRSWRDHQAPVVAAIGSKNVGKSTFARFLVNFLLNSHEAVAYLDTDVGQPEFTVPGCISLHIVREPVFGSPVLHLRNPERCFFYGAVSPKGNPDMYSQSVRALFDIFQRKYGSNGQAVPLVINTHGWIKGVGYDVLVDILRRASPTHVVQCTTKVEQKNPPAGKFWKLPNDIGQTDLLYIENALESTSRPLAGIKLASDHLRDSRVMAYFWQCISKNPLPYPYKEVKLFTQTAFGLVNHPPYQIPISAVKIRHLHCQVPTSESLYSISGALVGLGVTLDPSYTDLGEKNTSLGSCATVCVGLGIVRGIDVEKGLLYIITPLTPDLLEEVDTLLQGRVDVPVPLLQAKGYVSPYLCRNSVAVEGTGSVAMKSQKRFLKR